MIELQKRGMTSSSSASSSRDFQSKDLGPANGKVKDHTDSTSSTTRPQGSKGGSASANGSSGVAGTQTKATVSVGNKFQLLMGCSSDDGD